EQTFQNFNVVILDNSSDDSTLDAVCAFVRENNLSARILQTTRRLELADALNILLDQSVASFTKFIFADDYLGSDALATLMMP
ncbi:glycosyltransferase family A protein, partial [Acinetobacter baumannii]